MFPSSHVGKRYNVAPVSDIHELQMYFPLLASITGPSHYRQVCGWLGRLPSTCSFAHAMSARLDDTWFSGTFTATRCVLCVCNSTCLRSSFS